MTARAVHGEGAPRSIDRGDSGAGRSIGRRMVLAALVTAMAVGSLAMWTVVPLAWLWAASETTDNYFTIYLTALLGGVSSIVVCGWLLSRINRVYVRMAGDGGERWRPGWLKSVSAERGRRAPATVLEILMTGSLVIAIVLMLAWYFGFAPPPPGPPIPHAF